MDINLFDKVKVLDILAPDKMIKSADDIAAPKVGDIAYIIEIFEEPILGYYLECSDKNGITQWLCTFEPHEIKWEVQ